MKVTLAALVAVFVVSGFATQSFAHPAKIKTIESLDREGRGGHWK